MQKYKILKIKSHANFWFKLMLDEIYKLIWDLAK